jgi:P27 family predicted phage terminase small subunit
MNFGGVGSPVFVFNIMNSKTFKKDLVKILKSKNNYEKTDDLLIDELLFHISLLSDAKQDVIDNGFMINVRKDPDAPPLFNQNQSVSVVFQATKQVQSLIRQLGLSPADRLKLRIKDKKAFNLNSFLDEQ